MLSNYFRLAFRNLYSQRVYSLINIFSLAIGVAFVSLLYLLIRYEQQFDTMHPAADRTWRIHEVIAVCGVGERAATVPLGVGPYLREQHPDIVENYVRLFNFLGHPQRLRIGQKRLLAKKLYYTDSTFFQVFGHALEKGNRLTALQQKNSVVISHQMAREYFGEANPIGDTVWLHAKMPVIVTGVLAPLKSGTHIDPDFLVPIEMVRANRSVSPETWDEWLWNPAWTYLVLRQPEDIHRLEALMPGIAAQKLPEALRGLTYFQFMPLSDIHIKSRLLNEIGLNSEPFYVHIFQALGILIFLITVVNSANLATARASARMREVGIRKVLGADQGEIIIQFWVEFALMGFLALIVAFVIVENLLPHLSVFALSRHDFTVDESWMTFGLVTLVGMTAVLMASLYPAYALSTFTPLDLMSGSQRAYQRSKRVRQFLIVIQFAFTAFLLTISLVISRHWLYLRNAYTGFDEQVLVLNLNHDTKKWINEHRQTLLQDPDIEAISFMDDLLGKSHNSYPYEFGNGLPLMVVPTMHVGTDFAKTMRIKLLAGQDTPAPRDSTQRLSVIVNEELMHFLGHESPDELIGKQYPSFRFTSEVGAVAQNFHARSLHHRIEPFTLIVLDSAVMYYLRYTVIRPATTPQAALAALRKALPAELLEKEPDGLNDAIMLKDILDFQYERETRSGALSVYFALMAMLIACMGLFGLSSFMVHQRRREIAIRKAIGMSDAEVMVFFAREFVGLVAVSLLIAWPSAYLAMHWWLASYPYATQIEPFAFLYSGFILLLSTLLTVSYHAVRAAMQNPVKALK